MKNSRLIKLLMITLSILAVTCLIALSACTPTQAPASTTAPASTAATTAAPVEVINLKLSDPNPATNTHAILRQWWLSEVEKRTNGRLKIEVFPSGALASVPETLNFVKNGMVDMALIVPAYYPTDLPASMIAFLPFMAPAPDVALNIIRDLYNTNKSFQQEWEVKNNVKIMSYSPPSDQVGGSIVPIKTFEDLKGKKLRSTGSNLSVAQKCGAAPVNIAMTEMYDAISKGTIDGFFSLPYDMVGPTKLNEVCKSLFYWHCAAPGGSFDVMNMDVWNKLPADIQKALTDLRVDVDAYAFKNTTENELKWVKILANLPVNNFSDADVAKIKAAVLPAVYDEWIANATKAGVDNAAQMLADYQALSAKYIPQSTYENPWIK